MSIISAIDPVVIRSANEGDHDRLRRLAQLDSAAVPAGPMLIAEVGGSIRAAVALEGGAAIDDPFHPTAELVTLLRARAKQAEARSAQLRIIARSPLTA
jgi:hypothetical protein